MNCPDCRGQVELEFWENFTTDKMPMEDGYYRCPKCQQTYNPEDIDED
jgi:uncharacterized protein YbaR (Trm112 family)